MQSFLEEVLTEVLKDKHPLSETIFILPSKRAGVFLRNIISKTATKSLFAPEISSIEGFVEKISGLSYASNSEQLFSLYNAYLATIKGEKETFLSFSKWGQTLLQDFNEIDRYLIDTNKLFSNLSAIQQLTHWSVDPEPTQLVKNYIDFWNSIEPLYSYFNKHLLDRGMGPQGLVYREACNKLSDYLKASSYKRHVFIGFNALNTAEKYILQTILEKTEARIFWDIDSYFLNDPIHDAGYFIRQHKKEWPYLQKMPLQGISATYSTTKNIQITGIPKSVSQAKYVGNLLLELNQINPQSLKNTAVILADESLLNPILNSIPQQIEAVNITMGYPLQKTPLAGLFKQFIELYLLREAQGWFYKKILSFLAHPAISDLLRENGVDGAALIGTAIKEKNWTYVTVTKVTSVPIENKNLHLLFFNETLLPHQFVDRCIEIIRQLQPKFQNLDLEYLYRFYTLFNQIAGLVKKYPFISDIKSLLGLYNELLASETVDFRGDPLEGLQIMGMLESRNLDFETVILTSVNEGILPSGKSNSSFIPFDLKTSFGLPTYKEKDAVYTYHFYRLLQRAKNIHILYNTEADVLEGGEKSRLIAQLLTDINKIGQIVNKVATPSIVPNTKVLKSIVKSAELMALIKTHAARGFSPTSLSNYLRNPLDFYKRNLLALDDMIEVEETVAANTFGTIVHDTLEELYTPFIGSFITEAKLKQLKPQIQHKVRSHFLKNYGGGDISFGKNLIAYNVVVRYVENFIDLEIEDLKKHEVKLLSLEQKLKITLDLPEVEFPVVLKGKLDRVDICDGVLRIIDYKTGKVETKHVEIVNFEEIIDYNYNKAFQLLCYALMYCENHPLSTLESVIISFKNLKGGLLKFALKDKRGGKAKKDHTITQDTLAHFTQILKKLIQEICDPNIPLLEKEV